MSVRPPVVTILGHVDHGKNTLLDFVRKSRIAAKEFGGITQRIGAYSIKTGIKGKKHDRITFVDTPGHETFAQLRARGANVADIALLLIDAKDSLMPQTVESISHIKAAKIPFVVVLNKTDLPEANPEKVKTDLLKHQVMVEGKGGTVPVVNISAKTGQGVNDLLETILLLSSDLNLTFDENKAPLAYVIETKKDKRGIVASLIIKEGQIKVGDSVYALNVKGKVKSLINDMGKPMRAVIPSSPFELLGFESLPMVGAKVTDQATDSPDNTKSVKTKKVFDLDSIIKPVE
jgi:translation initiation factor IF-2